MAVWTLILMMWTVPTVEDSGAYNTYMTHFLTQGECEAGLQVTLKTKTPQMSVTTSFVA